MTLVLLSGGLDSAVLLSYIGNQGGGVQPVHIRCGYAWELAEAHCIQRLMKSALAPKMKPLRTARNHHCRKRCIAASWIVIGAFRRQIIQPLLRSRAQSSGSSPAVRAGS